MHRRRWQTLLHSLRRRRIPAKDSHLSLSPEQPLATQSSVCISQTTQYYYNFGKSKLNYAANSMTLGWRDIASEAQNNVQENTCQKVKATNYKQGPQGSSAGKWKHQSTRRKREIRKHYMKSTGIADLNFVIKRVMLW